MAENIFPGGVRNESRTSCFINIPSSSSGNLPRTISTTRRYSVLGQDGAVSFVFSEDSNEVLHRGLQSVALAGLDVPLCIRTPVPAPQVDRAPSYPPGVRTVGTKNGTLGESGLNVAIHACACRTRHDESCWCEPVHLCRRSTNPRESHRPNRRIATTNLPLFSVTRAHGRDSHEPEVRPEAAHRSYTFIR